MQLASYVGHLKTCQIALHKSFGLFQSEQPGLSLRRTSQSEQSSKCITSVYSYYEVNWPMARSYKHACNSFQQHLLGDSHSIILLCNTLYITTLRVSIPVQYVICSCSTFDVIQTPVKSLNSFMHQLRGPLGSGIGRSSLVCVKPKEFRACTCLFDFQTCYDTSPNMMLVSKG